MPRYPSHRETGRRGDLLLFATKARGQGARQLAASRQRGSRRARSDRGYISIAAPPRCIKGLPLAILTYPRPSRLYVLIALIANNDVKQPGNRLQIGRSFTRAPNSLSAGRHLLPPQNALEERNRSRVSANGLRVGITTSVIQYTVLYPFPYIARSTQTIWPFAVSKMCRMWSTTYILSAGCESLGDARLWPDRVVSKLDAELLGSSASSKSDKND
ncbi:hypothetical protein HD553DRAFT_1337 [Filobasidium floriforme]|uniref:uncharacterized protein n=1 Tax=Filobasidium floriforme TaxID=5210 RepID=UPI001E8D9849|nr:uncharacterized protein HD553DRAFT_1337 [Filobasidium floriforme]KAH8090323.1 hypothetical protein HD553DRAFT_1337 [Filobasidium floriforme]